MSGDPDTDRVTATAPHAEYVDDEELATLEFTVATVGSEVRLEAESVDARLAGRLAPAAARTLAAALEAHAAHAETAAAGE